uniref:ZMYM2-like/QRICH1 C-terminal domain-containing protein n=1 Tax=Schistocephalus solidus TaxID=70667 RepID=A0A0X3PDF7_SCHSO
MGQLQIQYSTHQNAAASSLGTTEMDLAQACQPQPSGFAPTPVQLLSLNDIPQEVNGAGSLQVFSQTVSLQESGAKATQFPLPFLVTSLDQQAGIVVSPAAAAVSNDRMIGPPGNFKNCRNRTNEPDRQNLTTIPEVAVHASGRCFTQSKADLVHITPPPKFRDPRPDELRSFQSVIRSTVALQCSNFPDYVSHLRRHGVLSLHKPWSLNFTAWFINSLAFCVENRTEHLALRWGDFRLGRCQQTSTEYLCFYNRVSQQVYFLRAEATPPGVGAVEPLCPCPVQVYKTLRDRRPANCQDAFSKFYLQPRSFACNKTNDADPLEAPGPWFTEHSWGKNKLGGLLAEAAKLAGLPVIWLPKRRSYKKGALSGPGQASLPGQKRPALTPPSQSKQARTPDLPAPSSMQWTPLCSVATVVSPSTLVPLNIDGEGTEDNGQMIGQYRSEPDVPQASVL